MLRKLIALQFKKPAGLLGFYTARLMMKNNQKNYDRLIKDLNLQPHDKLLEIGYGPGIGIHMIAEICATCVIHGIDFSRLMYKQASRYNGSFIDNGNVQLQYGDFLTTPVLDDNYDKVFCLNVIYFWDELKGPFKKVLSLLKKGGAFHFYMAEKSALMQKKVPDNIFNKYSIEQVMEALESVGFESVEHHYEKGLHIKALK